MPWRTGSLPSRFQNDPSSWTAMSSMSCMRTNDGQRRIGAWTVNRELENEETTEWLSTGWRGFRAGFSVFDRRQSGGPGVLHAFGEEFRSAMPSAFCKVIECCRRKALWRIRGSSRFVSSPDDRRPAPDAIF